MAARTGKIKHDAQTIERIRATVQSSQLVKALTEHVNGTRDLKNSQVNAALGLLRKTLPDLSAVEQTGEVTHNYVARVPTPAKTVTEWQQQHAAALTPPHPTPQ